jgi:poly(A) polymerase
MRQRTSRLPTMTADDRPLAAARWLRAEATGRVLAALEADGDAVRFVGGCVRDTLLDPTLDAVDIDIATPVAPGRNLELLNNAGIRTIPTGLAHGTITAIEGGRDYEITTLRQDVATDGRRATVAFTDCFLADAARRDFTINAMSCDRSGRLFDPFDGRADLAKGRIRFVGDPVARIREDYLRILRFFRFFARLGRDRPPPATLAALGAERAGLERLSGERLRAELLKLLIGRNVEASLALMAETGVWQAIVGAEPPRAVLGRLLAAKLEAGPILRLASLLRGVADPEVVADRLRLSNQERATLVDLTTAELPALDLPPAALRQQAYSLGKLPLAQRLTLAAAMSPSADAADAARRALAIVEAFEPPRLPVTGSDLMSVGLAPGPAMGECLRALERTWLESDFKADRETLLALAAAELSAMAERA